ncbi:hypothetical protein Moror_11138 [Moniliophthora roreri MCA 2997]|uniref:Uncharacterized protein n=1 Tax=Moniliophthora roreri (strain MCA 2997) TaxID=1381753 RepID=V2WM16_MONRO|nr:hypothetical protein Moror_11138 [Moniliophthora roreri MCA 2997]
MSVGWWRRRELIVDRRVSNWLVKGRKFALRLDLMSERSVMVGYHNPPMCYIFSR